MKKPGWSCLVLDSWTLLVYLAHIHSADVWVERRKDNRPLAAVVDHTLKDWVEKRVHLHLSHLRQSSLPHCNIILNYLCLFSPILHCLSIFDLVEQQMSNPKIWCLPQCWTHRLYSGRSTQTPRLEKNHVLPCHHPLQMSVKNHEIGIKLILPWHQQPSLRDGDFLGLEALPDSNPKKTKNFKRRKSF